MMANTGDDENDAVLSDVEGDDPVPVARVVTSDNISVEKFREILAELDREKVAREIAEKSKNDLQVSFNRLKALCHEAIKKRDESSRQRDDALREKDEAVKQLDEEVKVKDEAVREKELMRIEMEKGSSMLVSGIDKISRKVSGYKEFWSKGLPRSNKYSGLPAVAYGVIKRTNEIVEELVGQVEASVKSRDEARELVEQRNYEIAIEVSELESSITGLREEVAKKGEEIERLERVVDENGERFVRMEREFSESRDLMESEISKLRVLVSEYESKMEMQKPLLVDQLGFVSRMHEKMCEVMKVVDANEYSELSESLFLAQGTNMEENIRASLAGMESVYELSKIVSEKTRELVEERNREVKSLNETIAQLVKEKEQIGSLLRSTLSRRMSTDLSSKTNELFKVAENGLKEAGIDYKFSKFQNSEGKVGADETEENEVYALAGALENIIKQSQIEIIELKHSVEELRAELNLYKERVDVQAKELDQWKQRVEELEEKERVANENVEGLMMDISAAEEEITRWKVAAQQEAAAGKAIEQEYVAQLEAVQQELEEARQTVMESEKKLKFKEETADAAMAARDAAEKSLRLADMRATRLRDRVEELTRQLDELDTKESSRTGLSRPRYVCWPWQWLGLNYVGSSRIEAPQETANEMELSEPLL